MDRSSSLEKNPKDPGEIHDHVQVVAHPLADHRQPFVFLWPRIEQERRLHALARRQRAGAGYTSAVW